MNFNYYNPVKCITGIQCVIKNSEEFLKLGSSCLIVTSATAAKKSGALDDAMTALDGQGIKYDIFSRVEQNPTLDSCAQAGRIAREKKCEFILGVGGGSPLDASKAIAVFATNDMKDPSDIYNMNWANPALPIAAIGTTAGTGSEVTSFAVITQPNGRKRAFGTKETFPAIMFGDATYTETLPYSFTMSTALDALSHAVEGYFNTAASDITDLYAIKSTEILYVEIKKLLQSENITKEQRQRLYYASVLAGFALSQCGTLYCHNVGYYFTEVHDVPHGFACAATLHDLIERSARLCPDKAKIFYDAVGISADGLSKLVKEATMMPQIKIPKEDIERIAEDGAKTKNFEKTMPNGFTKQAAIDMLTDLFG